MPAGTGVVLARRSGAVFAPIVVMYITYQYACPIISRWRIDFDPFVSVRSDWWTSGFGWCLRTFLASHSPRLRFTVLVLYLIGIMQSTQAGSCRRSRLGLRVAYCVGCHDLQTGAGTLQYLFRPAPEMVGNIHYSCRPERRLVTHRANSHSSLCDNVVTFKKTTQRGER